MHQIFHTEEAWKVGRYTSAAPTYFSQADNYLDGCLLAFNPTEDAIATIQDHYNKRDLHLPISLVVSLGSGKNPPTLDEKTDITSELVVAALPYLEPFIKLLTRAVSGLSHIYHTVIPCTTEICLVFFLSCCHFIT